LDIVEFENFYVLVEINLFNSYPTKIAISLESFLTKIYFEIAIFLSKRMLLAFIKLKLM
jgi:hypothetical protein